jgi:hypothetical protein
MSKTQFEKPIPQTVFEIRKGRIYPQKKKCGKPNCKCARGEKHVAYYFFYRVNGKLFKQYIRQAELENARKVVDEFWERRNRTNEVLKMSRAHLKHLTKQWREQRAEIKAIKLKSKNKG